jgi:hypothetical protein
MRAGQHLAPGVTLKDIAAPSLRGNEGRERLAALYTPRGWQLRQLGIMVHLVCVLASGVLVINLVSLLPSIWHTKAIADPNQGLLKVVQNKPSIFLVWVAALVLAWLGFVGARFRWWLAAPVLALVIIWSRKLTGVFPGRHQEIIGTATERAYALQVWPAFIMVLVATGLGMRLWAARYNKRAQETPVASR